MHGGDLKDREHIFMQLLPEETFVDRRVNSIEQVELESDDEEMNDFRPISRAESKESANYSSIARQYVGELIRKVTEENEEKQ